MDTRLVDHAIRDTRYGLRLLKRSPIFAVVAILSLALGIGANAAIFHLIDTIQLRSLAIANPQRWPRSARRAAAFGTYDGVNAKATGPLWEVIRETRARSRRRSHGATPGSRRARRRVATGRGLWVSGDFFGALGIVPASGRLLGPDDDRNGCGAAAVISHGFWQSSFGGRESATGVTLTVLDRPVTVIGVAPASFTGLEVGETFDIALPLCATALWDGRMQQRERWWLTIMGRLKPEWTVEARERASARAEPRGSRRNDSARLRRCAGRRLPPAAVRRRSRGPRRQPAARRACCFAGALARTHQPRAADDVRQSRHAMLARASAREREVAVRAAIGASRGRLVSQMLIESLLVAAAGAVLAVPVALVSARALIDAARHVSRTDRASTRWQLAADGVCRRHRDTDGRRLRAAARAARLARRPQHGHAPGRPRHHGRSPSRATPAGLVVAQIALSLVLVFSALLFVQTFRHLAAVPTGFQPEGTLVISFMDRTSDALSAERKVAFQDQLTREIESYRAWRQRRRRRTCR